MAAGRVAGSGSPEEPARGPVGAGPRPGADAAALFSVLWAVAALFHVVSAPQRYEAFPTPNAEGLAALAVAVAAVAVLARPRDPRWLVGLAVVQLASVSSEAPVLGNHWLIAGFVAVAILLAAGQVFRHHRTLEPATLYEAFAPAARWILLLSYAFAAFAKLNRGFLDPSVSCAVFFLRESAGAVGLAAVAERAPVDLLHGVIVATVAIELALPLLLVVGRTRAWGVVLAVAFHTVLGLDLAHPFYDFSTLLFALFALFLPPSFATWLRARLRGDGADGSSRPVARPLVGAAWLVLGLLLLAAVGPASPRLAVLVFASAYLAWFAYAALAVVAVTVFVVSRRPRPRSGGLRLAAPVTAVVLPVVLLNGLSPYLELKSAFGFTMYSNVHLVDGRSNHLLVLRTLPLTDVHRDLVVVASSDDPGLQWYADHEYALPWRAFRTYLAEHPDVTVRYVRDGVTEWHRPGEEAPAPVPVWRQKVQAFRAVDLHDPPRCQDRWGPAN